MGEYDALREWGKTSGAGSQEAPSQYSALSDWAKSQQFSHAPGEGGQAPTEANPEISPETAAQGIRAATTPGRTMVDRGVFDAVSREATNIFWFGPAAQAGLETAVSKIPVVGPKFLGNAGYEQRRKAYSDALDDARNFHPVATELAGLGRGAAEAVGCGALVPALGAASPAVAGGIFGALEGTGEGTSHGEDAADIAKRATIAALAGAATGKVVGAVTDKLIGSKAGEAEQKLRNFVADDIVGDKRGASTDTSRKLMADDASDIADVVTNDPDLERSIRQASHQSPAKIGKALDVVDARLAPRRADRPLLYDELDQTIGGGVRSGDYVEHLERAATELEKKGTGQERDIAKQLRDRADLIKGAEDWGGNQTVFDPKKRIGGETAGELVSRLEAAKNSAANEAQKAAYDSHIQAIQEQSQVKGYNPDTIVPTEKLRNNVTDLQDTAYRGNMIASGGMHETHAYRRARETAHYAEDFLRSVKEKAAKTNPELVAKLAEHDKNVSALLNIKNVLTQRFNRATQDNLGGVGEDVFGRTIHALAKSRTHHGAIMTGLGVAAKGAIATQRAALTGTRAIERGTSASAKFAAAVLDYVRRGLPLASALAAAQAVAQPNPKDSAKPVYGETYTSAENPDDEDADETESQ